MSKKEFADFWAIKYPEAPVPINYLFKKIYDHRWFRIHSLPESKRYANTDQEWEILLNRQNTIIDELVPQNTPLKVVVNFIEIDSFLFKKYEMYNIGVLIDREAESVFQSFCFDCVWQTGTLNDLLIEVADDVLRAFIIGPDSLISPYDGGMDLILKDTETRDFYKKKYKDWLSAREDGH